jgi:hypothetical protein
MTFPKISLFYDKRRVVNTIDPNAYDYCMYVKTMEDTTPDVLRPCLVVNKGSSTQDERIVRVATWNDLFGTTSGYPLASLPASVNNFSSYSYGTIASNTTIMVQSPLWWQSYFGVSSYTVTTINNSGQIQSPLSAFARDLTFTINGVTYNDGVANRIYPGSSSLYTCDTHYSVWSDFNGAEDRYISMDAEATALVKSYNEDRFSNIVTKEYI